MTPGILFAGNPRDWPVYAPHLDAALADEGIKARIGPDLPPDQVTYIICAPDGPVSDFSGYPKLRAVLSLWAGVEALTRNETLTVPLARMADRGLRDGMVQWVTAHTLRHHIGMDAHILGQDGIWRAGILPPLADQRPVTILGLGALGTACGQALAHLGFPVTGWSRTARSINGLTCLAGADGLRAALAGAEILVTLLPLTPATRHILNPETFAWLPRGSVLINPGRGPLIDDAALLAALDAGHVAHATLDVFATEPLPPDHPYWAHACVTVTPHIASATRPDTAARFLARNIRRAEAGLPLLAEVNRAEGY